MARNQFSDALEAILSGGLQGYGQEQARQRTINDEIAKTIKLKQLESQMQQEQAQRSLENLKAQGFIGGGTDNATGMSLKTFDPISGKYTLGMPAKGNILKDKLNEAKLNELSRKSEDATDYILSTAQDNLDTVQKIKEGKKYFGAYGNLPTLATSLGGVVDYKNRKLWENNINKLLSQKVVDLISTMKSTSKTGATGFGQLSEKEGQLLKEASTALSKDLDKEDALYYLNEMEKIYKKILSKKTLIPEADNDNSTPVVGGMFNGEKIKSVKRL